MKKGVIIFTALAIMLLASLSLFAQYGRGYGRGGYGRNRRHAGGRVLPGEQCRHPGRCGHDVLGQSEPDAGWHPG